jgi:DNA modification methylase
VAGFEKGTGPEWAFEVDWWPIDKVTPYAKNPRRLGEHAVAKVAASLAAYGWRQPIVVDADGVVIAGHTRLLAARHLGQDTVPVHVARDLSPAQVKAYRIADNRAAQENTWDAGLLSMEVLDLKAMSADLDALGFDSDELTAALAPAPVEGRTDPDAVPDTPPVPTTKPGDLWLLGQHRILCGDSTKAEDVQRLMAGERAVLMATDPPYLVDYHGGGHPAAHVNPKTGLRDKDWEHHLDTVDKHWDDYVDPETSVQFYVDFLKVALEHALIERVPVYQWHGIMRTDIVMQAWREVGLLSHQILIWHKSKPVLTHAQYMWDYEPFMYGWPVGHMPKRKPPPDGRAVWEIASRIEDAPGSVHPTIKPVETIRRPIAYHTTPGGLICEPFCGSGTALIAAEELGRTCYALELSPVFCDVAVARWQAFTGKTASRESHERA